MGRKWELEKSCHQYLKRIRSGSFQTKKSRERVIHKIIYDLAILKRLPYSLSAIKFEDIISLVDYWRENKLQTATIVNRLGVLRSINRLADLKIIIPSNAELALKKSIGHKNQVTANPIILEKVFHPITQNVLAFQLYFGLTELEAIRIDPMLISHNHSLMVMKQVAHNHKERLILIVNATQKSILCDRKKLCADAVTAETMRQLVQSELHFLNIRTPVDFRSHYANTRFQAVCEKSDKNSAIKTLMREMGFSKANRVREWLHHE